MEHDWVSKVPKSNLFISLFSKFPFRGCSVLLRIACKLSLWPMRYIGGWILSTLAKCCLHYTFFHQLTRINLFHFSSNSRQPLAFQLSTCCNAYYWRASCTMAFVLPLQQFYSLILVKLVLSAVKSHQVNLLSASNIVPSTFPASANGYSFRFLRYVESDISFLID